MSMEALQKEMTFLELTKQIGAKAASYEQIKAITDRVRERVVDLVPETTDVLKTADDDNMLMQMLKDAEENYVHIPLCDINLRAAEMANGDETALHLLGNYTLRLLPACVFPFVSETNAHFSMMYSNAFNSAFSILQSFDPKKHDFLAHIIYCINDKTAKAYNAITNLGLSALFSAYIKLVQYALVSNENAKEAYKLLESCGMCNESELEFVRLICNGNTVKQALARLTDETTARNISYTLSCASEDSPLNFNSISNEYLLAMRDTQYEYAFAQFAVGKCDKQHLSDIKNITLAQANS